MWKVSGHARCPDPPEGCGERTVQWNGKGPAVIHHGPSCPVETLAIIHEELKPGEWHAHSGYVMHSHEVRHDHLGVDKV